MNSINAKDLLTFHMSDEIILLGLHKARYLCSFVPKEKREESRDYLIMGNHTVDGKEVIQKRGVFPQ